jgi:hypothetical protein
MLAPNPSMEFESEILLTGNPDSGQKQRALNGYAFSSPSEASRKTDDDIAKENR